MVEVESVANYCVVLIKITSWHRVNEAVESKFPQQASNVQVRLTGDLTSKGQHTVQVKGAFFLLAGS